MNSNGTSPGPRYEALLQVLRTSEAVWNASRVFFDQWDLSPSQFNVLNALDGNKEGMTQIELSRALIMHRSNVTGLIDRLEKRGLVERRDNPGDRRAYRVVLTTSGAKLLRKILPAYYAIAEAIWGSYPAVRARELAGELKKLSDNIEQLPGLSLS